jgi:salicylate hydroxylase
MPPQGESVGLALEDVVLLSTLFAKKPDMAIDELFQTQDKLRRERIEKAYDEASMRFETVKDKGWVAGMLMESITGIFLSWTKASRDKNLEFDVRTLVS